MENDSIFYSAVSGLLVKKVKLPTFDIIILFVLLQKWAQLNYNFVVIIEVVEH